MKFTSLLAGFPKATVAFFTVNPLFCAQFEAEIQEYDVTGLFLYHFHLTHRERTPAVFCNELTKKVCLKFDHSRRSVQASLRLQAAQQAGFQGRTEGRAACA